MGWVGNLGDEKRRSHLCKGGTETDEETRADEHAEVLSGGLEDGTNQDDGGTKNDTSLATETVRDVRSNGDSAESTNGLDGVEETEILWFWVTKVGLPMGDGLKTVHHGTIEAVGIRGDEGDEEQNVELDNVAVLPPFS